jgi:hypothetical protein
MIRLLHQHVRAMKIEGLTPADRKRDRIAVGYAALLAERHGMAGAMEHIRERLVAYSGKPVTASGAGRIAALRYGVQCRAYGALRRASSALNGPRGYD